MNIPHWPLIASVIFLSISAPSTLRAAASEDAQAGVRAEVQRADQAGGRKPGHAKASPAHSDVVANAAHRKAEHERIGRERAALSAGRQRDEAACYKRFAVEDCLREIRVKVREVETALRAQEVALNDAERREKAAERLRAIEEKQSAAPDSSPAGKTGDTKVRKARVDPGEVKTQRAQDAQQRAQQQREHAQTQAVEQASRAASNTERAAKTRERHDQALKSAQERRLRVEKDNADALAQGRKPAAPLPVPSAAQ